MHDVMHIVRGTRHGAGRFSLSGLVLMTALAAACGGGGEKQAGGDTTTTPPPAGGAAGGAATAAVTGEQVFQRCVTCHQATGQGLAGTFPPLVGSEFANAANPSVPIRVVLHGLEGPITVKGQQFNGVMPPYGTGIEMSDEEVAAVLTYVRSSWGNSASPITPQDVAKERAAQRTATGAATEAELKAMMEGKG